MAGDDTERTGRVIVTFPRGQVKSLLEVLHTEAGLAKNAVADARDFATTPADGWLTPGVTLDDIGIAAFKTDLLDATRIGALLGKPVLSARPEYFMRRPKTERNAPGLDVLSEADPAWFPEQQQTWALNAIGLEPELAEGEGVRVGLIDGGVDRTHPDLAPAIETWKSFVPGKKADEDEYGHGTHCAGLIAGAKQPQGGPRYGVAPRARLTVVRIFDDTQKAPEVEVMRALKWAAAQGCHILSLSVGRDVDDRVFPEDDQLGQELALKGVLLFASAGNESDRKAGRIEPACSPANARSIPAVGAMNMKGRLWNESNGKDGAKDAQVDLVAPGVRVVSASPGGGTSPASGTSVATPIVAGVAAVLKSRTPALRGLALLEQTKSLAQRLAQEPVAGVGAGLVKVK